MKIEISLSLYLISHLAKAALVLTSPLGTGGQYDSSTTLERVALNFCPEPLNIFVADFCCGDIIERVTVALGRRPMSENASKVLQQKPGGQETLPRNLSDNKILFEWCCPPVSGFLMPPPSPSAAPRAPRPRCPPPPPARARTRIRERHCHCHQS